MEDLSCFSYLQVNWSEGKLQILKLWKVHPSLVINPLREPQMSDIATVGGIVSIKKCKTITCTLDLSFSKHLQWSWYREDQPCIYRKLRSQTTQKTIYLFLKIHHNLICRYLLLQNFYADKVKFNYLIKPDHWSKLNASLQFKIIYFLHKSTQCNFSVVSSIKVSPENVLIKILN